MATTTEVGKAEPLDGELWSALPEDITLSILARLPLRDLARYRTVCKKWQAMWHSPSFLQVRPQVTAEKSWFVFNRLERESFLSARRRDQPTNSTCLCYNAGVNNWHSLMFNNVPHTVDRVAATAGGLMFCVRKPNVIRMRIAVVFWSWPVMIVCNPLKENCSTLLPGRQCNWKPHTVGMVVDSKTNTFKIVLATVHQGTEIYDSRQKCWKLLEFCRPPALSCHPEAISHKGNIYAVGVNSIVVFDVEEEAWSSFDLPHPEREFRNTQLYDCEERLLLVGCLMSGDVGEEARMLVWELVGGISSRGVWRQLSSVSIQEVSVAFRPELEKQDGHNDLLFVRGLSVNLQPGNQCGSTPLSGDLEQTPQENAFLYSLSHNAWYIVDESSTYSQRLTKYEGDGLRFEPRIEATV